VSAPRGAVFNPSAVPLPPPKASHRLHDGYSLSPLAIGEFNRAEIFAPAADDDDAPASEIRGLFVIGMAGHAGKSGS
jgi:hypothetical protein